MKTGRFRQCIYCLIFLVSASAASAQAVVCPANIDFEHGSFQNWQSFLGNVSLSGGTNVVNVSGAPPTNGRHTLITPAYAGVLDFYGSFPVLCPNGSGYSIKLGNNSTNRQSERVSYTFTIPSGQNEYSLIYQYAVVFQDPNHTTEEQPRFTARVYDVSTGNYVSCASYDIVATSNLPGFSKSGFSSNVWFKPWTPVTINLSGYAGRTVILEFTTADCTQGGHFGYAYVDVNAGCTSPVGGAIYCAGSNSVTLNGPYGYQNYSWYDQGMSQLLGTQQQLTVSPTPPVNTTYALDLIPFPGFGCRDTVYATITPSPLPAANAGPDQTTCSGGEVSLGGPPLAGYTYQWFPETGLNNHAVSNPVARPLVSTDYILTVTNTASGCTKTDTVSVVVGSMPPPVFSVSGPAAQCLTGNEFHFIQQPLNGYQYTWKFGDGSTGSMVHAHHQYLHAGDFSVTLIGTSPGGCTDSISRQVVVHPLPSGSLSSAETRICEGSTVLLTASGGVKYEWFRDGNALGTNPGNFQAQDPGTYSVRITDTNGCSSESSNTIKLELIKKPVPDFGLLTNCVDLPSTFKDQSQLFNSSPVQYYWEFDNGQVSELKEPSIIFTQAGQREVKLSVVPLSCPQLSSQVKKTIEIKKPLGGQVYKPVHAISGQAIQLEARNIGSEFRWHPSRFLSHASQQKPVFTGNAEQTYLVQITNPSGCITVDTQLVRLFRETDILVPKAFTPNGDGLNDRMFPFMVGLKELVIFRIINRWGVMVYESRTEQPGWDGRYQGKQQPLGGYVWEAQGIDTEGKTIFRKGSFTLIR